MYNIKMVDELTLDEKRDLLAWIDHVKWIDEREEFRMFWCGCMGPRGHPSGLCKCARQNSAIERLRELC